MQPSNVVAIGILGQDSHIAEDLFKPQSDSAQYRRFLIVLAFTLSLLGAKVAIRRIGSSHVV